MINFIIEAGRYVQIAEQELLYLPKRQNVCIPNQLAPQRSTFCTYIDLCRPNRTLVLKDAGSYGHFAVCLLFKCTNYPMATHQQKKLQLSLNYFFVKQNSSILFRLFKALYTNYVFSFLQYYVLKILVNKKDI